VIKGKKGNDKITGLAGQDCLSGGKGDDKIKARDGESDRINCGAGKDSVKADALDVIKGNCEKVKTA
jgi:Ca2+-binding RTX toxin-like protein